MKRKRDKTPASFLCAAKYPVVLVHGTGFRDRKHLDYWGRIPGALAQEGAKVFYSHQDAWGTVERNAAMVKRAVTAVLAETSAEKVNILAHSKGGLEARYMIAVLGMGDRVASLTTICTPHHGSKTMDAILKTIPRLYRFAGWFVDRFFKLLGDAEPAFYETSRQFTTAHARAFNEAFRDDERVYMQSYASSLRSVFDDFLFGMTHLFVRRLDGPNDGLVSVESAKWGRYRGEMNAGKRGLSHADEVDALRMNVKGYDIRRFFIEVVRELKEMGF